MLPGSGGTRRERGASHARNGCCSLTLVLAILALSSAAFASNRDENCLTLEKEARNSDAVARSVRVKLAWASAPARAAAALLRAALLAAGHHPHDVTLLNNTIASEVCALLDAATSLPVKPGEVVVAVGVPWSAQTRCEWAGRAPFEVLGPGTAPVSPRLHVRLAPLWADAAPDCVAVLNSRPVPTSATLRDCGFLRPGTEDENDENATLFTLKDEWKNETEVLCARLERGPLRCVELTRDRLLEHVDNGTASFLFFDAELWRDKSGVHPLTAGLGAPHAPRSLLVANRNLLLKHAPALHLMVVGRKPPFRPTESDLRDVLVYHARVANATVEDAACRLAPAASEYSTWLNAARRTSARLATVIVCAADAVEDYLPAFEKFKEYLDKTTKLTTLKASFEVENVRVNCSDPSALAVTIAGWENVGLTWRTVGVVAPAEQAIAAAANAKKHKLPLLSYTPAPAPAVGMRSATGGPELLAHALRRLLAACEWRRLGVVSENTPLARAVSAALATDDSLRTHETHSADPREALSELMDLDTRVFFVNGDAPMAARVLAAAADLPSSEHAHAHAWIVRDYDGPDGATARLQPLSLSFEWRGEGRREGAARDRLALLEPDGWRNRTWPRRAASVLDALITLGVGFERLVARDKETLDYPDKENKLSNFWRGVETVNVSGVVEDLKYDERGVMAPRVYVLQWKSTGDVRPLRRGAWRAGEPPPRHERCPLPAPVHDGTAACVAPGADRYRPTCYDAAWITAGLILAVALLGFAIATRSTRRWLARRDRRLERATTARILVQREAAFAELAPHLVDSSALVLGDELGAGRFGRVRRGEVRAARRRPAAVAVKALRDGATPAEESQFLREARLLAALHHEHVVRFRGVCWEGGPPLLLMELALFGDLLRYLRARRHLAEGAPGDAAAGPEEAAAVSAEALTRLAREAAEALAYLGSRGLVHRDVRAANCLVDARRSLKLADFGLARETGAADGEYACRGRALFPVLWMAPESLARGVATAASDAWSFGVLALELVTLGARPFGGAAPEAVVRAVLAGGRPPLPRDACAETRALALACWRREPGARPPAARVAAWLARRTTALRPALAPDLEEPDCDSGIGEPDSHLYRVRPALDGRSASLVTLAT